MKDFLKARLLIEVNGNWNLSEIVAVAMLLVLVVIAVLGIVKLIKRLIKSANPRKDTIFSHRKNKYKNSIGKKNKY